MYIISIIAGLFLLSAIATFFYLVIQPAQHEKIERRRSKTPQEIDSIFNEVDPFDATEMQGFSDN